MVFFQQKKVMMVYHIADFTLPEVDSNPKKSDLPNSLNSPPSVFPVQYEKLHLASASQAGTQMRTIFGAADAT